MQSIIETNIINGKKYRFEIIQSTSFEQLEDNRNVNGFAINKKNEVLLVKGENKPWAPPGGAIDEGETPEQALIRELYEEVAVHIDPNSIKPLFYQKTFIDINNDGKLVYVGNKLRFVCRINFADTFISDPDNSDITEQMYSPIDELNKYVKWGKTIKFIQELLRANI